MISEQSMFPPGAHLKASLAHERGARLIICMLKYKYITLNPHCRFRIYGASGMTLIEPIALLQLFGTISETIFVY